MAGWVKIYRDIKTHWIWENEKYLKAWLTILLTVNHEDCKMLIENELIECKRGQSLMSLKNWSLAFGKGWSIQKVRTLFILLKNDSMINIEGLRKTTRITVCNYEYYQNGQQTDNTQTTDKQQADNKEITTNKKDKEGIKKEIHNTWREDFEIYLKECKEAYMAIWQDKDFIRTQQRLHPGINVKLSIEKGYTNFWHTEAGWAHKKKSRSKEIDWKATIRNSIDMNKVYYTKEELAKL